MVSCTHIRVFISSKMNLGKMYLTKKKKKNYIYRYIYLKHLLYKAFTLLQGLTWLWVLATYWIDQGETEAMNDVILGLEGRKMKLSQKKKKLSYEFEILMEVELLSSNKVSITKEENSSQWRQEQQFLQKTAPTHFFSVLFYMPHHSPTLDVFVSSNVFHFNAVLSVCWAVKNSDEL